MSTIALAGIVRPLFDSYPITGPAGTAGGNYLLFNLSNPAGSSDGTDKVLLEIESTTTDTALRAYIGTATEVTITVTYTGTLGTFIKLGAIGGSGPSSFTATMATTD